MKRSFWVMTALALVVLVLAGCQNNQTRAQRLYDAGRYDEVIARYGNDPAAAEIVQDAREKVAEGLLQAGRYQAIIDSYPQTPAAEKARDKLAEGLFQERRYQEVITLYPNTDWARRAREEMTRDTTGGRTPGGIDNRGTGGTGGTGGADNTREQAAQAELDRIMNIKVPDLRTKALREFAANPQYAGTRAVQRAQNELNRR